MQHLNSSSDILFIAPDVPEEYMLDTDAIDSIYISQRYFLQALLHIRDNKSVKLIAYDVPEFHELLGLYRRQWLISASEFLQVMDSTIFVPSEHYTLTGFMMGRKYDWRRYVESRWWDLPFEQMTSQPLLAHLPWDTTTTSIKIKGYKVTDTTRDMRRALEAIYPWALINIIWEQDALTARNLWWKSFLHNGFFNNNERISFWVPRWVYVNQKDWYSWLEKAVKKLNSDGVVYIVCKPVFAASGEGIILLKDPATIPWFLRGYDFPFWDVVLEEYIDLDSISKIHPALWNDPLSFSVQFQEAALMWEPTVQLTHNWEFKWNIRMSEETTALTNMAGLVSEVRDRSHSLIKRLSLSGNWGFDFLVSKDGRTYFIDPNLWRDTWALPLRTFDSLFWEASQDVMFVKMPAHGIGKLDNLIENLQQSDIPLFWDWNKIGVMPATFIAGQHLSVVIVANNIEQLSIWYSALKQKLEWLSCSHTAPSRLIDTIHWKLQYLQLHNKAELLW